MRSILAALIMLATPLAAQPQSNCGKISSCPGQFMPTPTYLTSAGKSWVGKAWIDAEATQKVEDAIGSQLTARLNAIKSDLEKDAFFPGWSVDDKKVIKAALSDPEYLRLMANLQIAVANNYDARNAAILEVVTAFQLRPPIPDFTGAPSAAGSNMTAKPWFPKYSRREIFDEKTGRWRKRNAAELAAEEAKNTFALNGITVAGGVATARTRGGDGDIALFDQAFDDPETMAITILHETSHWLDIAARSGGFRRSDPPEVSFRTEQLAYERAAVFARTLGKNPKNHLDLAAQFKRQADQAIAENLRWDQISVKHPDWIGRDRQGSFALAPGEPNAPNDDSLLTEKMAEARAMAAAKVRDQLEIAHRDHDHRLRNTYVEYAQRSCSFPGSVNRDDLARLPEPYDANYYLNSVPHKLGECIVSVYLYLGASAVYDVNEIRRLATPPPPPEAINAQPVPTTPAPVRGAPTMTFGQILYIVKDFAVASCRVPGQASLSNNVMLPRENILFLPSDDGMADRLSVGLEVCELLLFRRLITEFREGNPRIITSQWIKDVVRAYTPPPAYTPPRYPSPPPRRCEDYGNIRCPK